jgi:dolichyl-phosphate-mannose--protein O-mannosyl transferase
LGIGAVQYSVFDEVYYVKFAHDYLTQTPPPDQHPPLSKYLIAIGIWLGNQLPIGTGYGEQSGRGRLQHLELSLAQCLTGALIPLVVSGLAWQLTRRYRYSFLAGLFAALDGLFLVESRYALNNVYLDILGLLGLWCLLLALDAQKLKREAWLVLSGICFGAAFSIKWNGLWFLLGAYGLWVAAWIVRLLQKRRFAPVCRGRCRSFFSFGKPNPAKALASGAESGSHSGGFLLAVLDSPPQTHSEREFLAVAAADFAISRKRGKRRRYTSLLL